MYSSDLWTCTVITVKGDQKILPIETKVPYLCINVQIKRDETVKKLFFFLDYYKNWDDYFSLACAQCKHLKLRLITNLINFVLPQPDFGCLFSLVLIFFITLIISSETSQSLISVTIKDWPQLCRWWSHSNFLGLFYTEITIIIITIIHKTKSFISLTKSEINFCNSRH